MYLHNLYLFFFFFFFFFSIIFFLINVSNNFDIYSRVGQGYLYSLVLFNLFINEILDSSDKHCVFIEKEIIVLRFIYTIFISFH